MVLEENTRKKFDELIQSSASLRRGNTYGQIRDAQHGHSCKAWLASAHNLTHFVLGTQSNPYKAKIDALCSREHGLLIPQVVGDVATILEFLWGDIERGLISSIENQTKAIVFDDFLDHAKSYSKRQLPKQAGVISGVVFEDTLRVICRNHGISEKGNKLDSLISELSKIGVLDQLKAKRARVAADVRTKATHAQWDEFSISDVRTVIEFTEQLIAENLAK